MDEKQKKHRRVKRTIKAAGILLTIGGIALSVMGFVSFFDAFENGGSPSLFWGCFVGMPMFAFGVNFLRIGFKREIETYGKNESVPVINEASQELKPAIKAIAGAVREGLQEDDGAPCPVCGTPNDSGAKFCSSCGAKLQKYCPACGQPNDAAAKFCDKCGNRFP